MLKNCRGFYCVGLFVTSLLFASNSFASKGYLTEFKKTYPDFKGATCKLCHGTLPQLNPYGLDYQKYEHDFKKIEELESDGDTYTNISEINANTLPGDKESHPGSTRRVRFFWNQWRQNLSR